MTRENMSDQELDRLLAAAGRPEIPQGAQARLMARLGGPSRRDNVIAFQPRPAQHSTRISWLAALPLAASLAFGLWLGIAGVGTDFLPDSLGGDSLAAADLDSATGIDEAEALAEDNQT